jgi:hypothetical protein
MIIIVKHIQANTHKNELLEYVAPVLKRSFPFKSGRIVKTEILALRDRRTDQYEYHGLIVIEPERSGRIALIKLKGKRFNNKLVIVKEYRNRDWHNDRRVKHVHNSAEIIQKRIGDRRRGNKLELITDASNMFVAVNPARKLI